MFTKLARFGVNVEAVQIAFMVGGVLGMALEAVLITSVRALPLMLYASRYFVNHIH